MSKAITQEQTEYFDALEEMFATQGWKTFVEEATAMIYQCQADALEQPSWDHVNVLRGKALQLAEIKNLEEVTLMQRALLEEDLEDADV
jgi:hypothetical protein